jgi:hypothetical protein
VDYSVPSTSLDDYKPHDTSCVRDEDCLQWEKCQLDEHACVPDKSKATNVRTCSGDSECGASKRCSTLSHYCVDCVGPYCREFELSSASNEMVYYGLALTRNRIWMIGWAFNSSSFSKALLLKYEDHQWTSIDLKLDFRLRGIWVDELDQPWIAGNNGTLLRFDKTQERWDRLPLGTNADLYAGWTAPDGTTWVVGGGGTVLQFVPNQTPVALSLPMEDSKKVLRAVWGISATDILVGGQSLFYRWVNGVWSKQTISGLDSKIITGLHGVGPTDMWASYWDPTNKQGGVLHNDGVSGWLGMDSRTSAFWAVAALGQGVAYAAGDGLITKIDPRLGLPVPETVSGTCYGLLVESPSRIWAVGNRAWVDPAGPTHYSSAFVLRRAD